MASVFKKKITKPVPATAEIVERNGQRVARWKNRRGVIRTAPVTTGRNGSDRIVVVAKTYTAKYRDGQGLIREIPTRCRDEQAARQVLADLVKRAERVRANFLSPEEDGMLDHFNQPLATHIAAYLISLESRGASAVHRRKMSGGVWSAWRRSVASAACRT